MTLNFTSIFSGKQNASRHVESTLPSRVQGMTLPALSLAAFLLCAPGASAAQFYTSEEYNDFINTIAPDYHEEIFPMLDSEGPVDSPFVTDGGNGFAWSLAVDSGAFWSLGNSQLSTDSPNDVFLFTFTGRTVYAFGGNFWGTDASGDPQTASITFSTNTGESIVHSVNDSTGFIGIISSVPLDWVSVEATAGAAQIFPATTNVVTAIPEPATTALFLGGAAIGLCIWFRKRTGKNACLKECMSPE